MHACMWQNSVSHETDTAFTRSVINAQAYAMYKPCLWLLQLEALSILLSYTGQKKNVNTILAINNIYCFLTE